MSDTLHQKMKKWEDQTCSQQIDKNDICICRLDGKAFHTFTKGLNKPFDENLSNLLIETTKYLMNQSNAIIGYTQSDEITLILMNQNEHSEFFLGGKIFKLNSILAAMASTFFCNQLQSYLPCKSHLLPIFDCRAFPVTSEQEAMEVIETREIDAKRNSIQAVAQSLYSHKELHQKNRKEQLQMIKEKGKSWDDYHPKYKFGTYILRKKVLKPFSFEEIKKLPAKHEARKNPELKIERNELQEHFGSIFESNNKRYNELMHGLLQKAT